MNYIEIVDWQTYQHYKKRNPIWIKLYVSLLSNYRYYCLQDDSKLLYITLLLLAAKSNNKTPMDHEYIRHHGNIKGKIDLQTLEDKGFIKCYQVDSKAIDTCNHPAIPETETETENILSPTPSKNGLFGQIETAVKKKKTEKGLRNNYPQDFERFWQSYPRQVGKGGAYEVWKKINPDEELEEEIMQGLFKWDDSEQWAKDNGKYIPYPEKWLRKRSWQDDPEMAGARR